MIVDCFSYPFSTTPVSSGLRVFEIVPADGTRSETGGRGTVRRVNRYSTETLLWPVKSWISLEMACELNFETLSWIP